MGEIYSSPGSCRKHAAGRMLRVLRRGASMRCRGFVPLVMLACLARDAYPQTDSLRLARLSALGRLFGVVKYFHPAFLEREVAWDSATLVAIDAVSAAKSQADFRSAIDRLLSSLGENGT